MVRDRLGTAGEVNPAAELNREYKVEGAGAELMANLLSYMNITLEDTRITLDQKLNLLRLDSKKPLPGAKRPRRSKVRSKHAM